MSREVRRVPLGWKHPTTHNEHWLVQAQSRARRGAPESTMHGQTERFVGLFDDYAGRLADWEQELRDLQNRTGSHWEFQIEYHLTGFQGQKDRRPVVHPFHVYNEASDDYLPVDVRDEDHLYELAVADKERERPDPADYMPTWDVPEDQLGWCLYETVTEGTPVTPVFTTAGELINHLATVGQDWDQQPMRRRAAEALVSAGGSIGSMVSIGSTLYKSDTDADLLADKLDGGQS